MTLVTFDKVTLNDFRRLSPGISYDLPILFQTPMTPGKTMTYPSHKDSYFGCAISILHYSLSHKTIV